jgi:hypothetical protein
VPSRCWRTRTGIDEGSSEGWRFGVARTLPWNGATFTGPLSKIPESSELNCLRASPKTLKGSRANPKHMMSEYIH